MTVESSLRQKLAQTQSLADFNDLEKNLTAKTSWLGSRQLVWRDPKKYQDALAVKDLVAKVGDLYENSSKSAQEAKLALEAIDVIKRLDSSAYFQLHYNTNPFGMLFHKILSWVGDRSYDKEARLHQLEMAVKQRLAVEKK